MSKNHQNTSEKREERLKLANTSNIGERNKIERIRSKIRKWNKIERNKIEWNRSSPKIEWNKIEWNKIEKLRKKNILHISCLGYVPISSSAPRPLGAAYVPILLSEVEQEQRPSGNGDREAIVVGAGLCDGEGERAYIAYAPHWYFRFQKVHMDWIYLFVCFDKAFVLITA